MPRYEYECDNCKYRCIVFHSIEEKLTICDKCNGNLNKIFSFKKKVNNFNNKPGEVVKRYINETKLEIEKQKEEMKKEYKE